MAEFKTKYPLMLATLFIFLFSILSLEAAQAKEKTGNEEKDKKEKKVQKVQAAETMNEQVFTQNMFEKLPKGRDFLSIAPLVPGVNYEQLLAGVSIDGASGAENRYYVEGVDTTTQYTGESGMRVNFDFTEEVRVQASGIPAESTGSTGGVIRVKTRGGGNEFHGAALFYFESSGLTGKPRETLRVDPLDQNKAEYVSYPKDKWHSIEPGFTLGGPIVKDKLWFFVGVMPRYKTTTRNGNHWPAPDLSTGERISTIFAGENHSSGSNIFDRKDTYYAGLLKFTGQPLDNLRFSISGLVDYSEWKGELPPVDGSGEPYRDYAPIAYEYPKLSIAGSIDYTVSDRLSLFLTGGYYRSNERELAAPDLPFKIHMTSNEGIPGIPPEFVTPKSSIYLRYAAPQLTKNIQETLSGAFDLAYYFNLVGQHSVKAGVQVVRTGVDKDADIPLTYKRFYWGKDYGHVDGPVNKTTLGYIEVRTPWGIEAKVHGARLAVYLRDSWTVGHRLTLDLGLRAEKEDIPTFTTENITPIHWNLGDKLAPRIGFSYNMLKDSSLQIYGSFCVYYDIMKLALAEKYFGGFKWLSHYYDIVNWDWKNGFPEAAHPQPGGYAGGRYFETIDFRGVNYANTQSDIKPFRKNEFTFGVRKTLNEDWTVSGRFLYNYIANAVEDIMLMGGSSEFSYCANPGSAWIQAWYQMFQEDGFIPGGVKASRAVRRYTSASISLDRKLKNNWFGGFSYTWSRLYGNYSGLAGSDEDGRIAPGVLQYFNYWFQGYNQYGKEELGLLRTDRPHQFKIYGAYVFDFGLTLGCSAYAVSGVPLQTAIYVNNLKGFYPLGRGSAGRTPWLWQIDLYAEYNLKLSDTFTLQFNVNVTNLTDNDMARNRYMLYNDANINLPETYFLSGFDYIRVIAEKGAHLDPRYNKAYDYLDPIAARLGVKLMF